MTTYQVVIKGVTAERSVSQVAEALAPLFKVPMEKLVPLLQAPTSVVKRTLDLADARRYEAILLKAGAICIIEAESPQKVAASPVGQQTASRSETLFCSACGAPVQEHAQFCKQCGAKVNLLATEPETQSAQGQQTPSTASAQPKDESSTSVWYTVIVTIVVLSVLAWNGAKIWRRFNTTDKSNITAPAQSSSSEATVQEEECWASVRSAYKKGAVSDPGPSIDRTNSFFNTCMRMTRR